MINAAENKYNNDNKDESSKTQDQTIKKKNEILILIKNQSAWGNILARRTNRFERFGSAIAPILLRDVQQCIPAQKKTVMPRKTKVFLIISTRKRTRNCLLLPLI